MPKKATYLDEVINNLGGKVDKGALAQAIVDEFGGPVGLGKLIARELKRAESGSNLQAQLLRAVISLVTDASDQTNIKEELSKYSMQDLEKMLSAIDSRPNKSDD